MISKHTLRNLLVRSGSAMLAISSASAATVLYFDDFSGDAADTLHATTPNTTIGSNTWIANTDWKADGSNSAGGAKNAFLEFTPTAGVIYTLTAILDKPTVNGGSGSWWGAIGFTDTALTAATFWDGTNAAAPWMLYRANSNDIAAFGGLRTANGSGNLSGYTGTQTLTIVLDTTGSAWKAEWFVGASSVFTHTYATNPIINHVGIGTFNATTDFSSLSLSVIPEPTTALLGSLGFLMLFRRRR
jgi:hypothetical protein